MPSLIPSPYPVVHIARTISNSEFDPDTGNPLVVDADPVVRYAQGLSQIGLLRGSSKRVYTDDFVERVQTELHLAVADESVYSPGDQVILQPTLDDDGNYVAATGYAYQVDGIPFGSSTSPWPTLSAGLGGVCRLRRIT